MCILVKGSTMQIFKRLYLSTTTGKDTLCSIYAVQYICIYFCFNA